MASFRSWRERQNDAPDMILLEIEKKTSRGKWNVMKFIHYIHSRVRANVRMVCHVGRFHIKRQVQNPIPSVLSC